MQCSAKPGALPGSPNNLTPARAKKATPSPKLEQMCLFGADARSARPLDARAAAEGRAIIEMGRRRAAARNVCLDAPGTASPYGGGSPHGAAGAEPDPLGGGF